jgi:hypothetical protein
MENVMKMIVGILVCASVAFAAEKSAKNETKKAAPISKKSHAAMVFFEEPQDGAKVPTKFTVKMGVMGFDVKPAGDKTPQSGHHHILIDTDPIPEGSAVPMGSPKHLHFGKGQTETEVELTPGKHTLQLQFADLNHVSMGEKMSATISVTVEEPAKK